MDDVIQKIDTETAERLWTALKKRQGQLRPQPRLEDLLFPGDLVQFREGYCEAQGARWNPSVEKQSRVMRGIVSRKVERAGAVDGTYVVVHWFTGDFVRVEHGLDLNKRGLGS